MQAVPPPMTGNYLPTGPDVEIDDSKYTYGPAKTQPELDTCVSNISTESSELVFEPVVNESQIEVQPKVWSDAPIIEEYESDSDDEYVSVKIEDLDTPSFANKQIKTSRKNLKNQSTKSQKPKVNNKEDYPHRNLKNKGIIDSGCSRHMTGNKAYLADFQDYNGGPVAFGGSKGYITGDLTQQCQPRQQSQQSDSEAHAFVSYVQKQRRNNHKDFHLCLFACFLSQHEPKKISEALEDESWVDAMQEDLLQFEIQKVWILVDLPYGKKAIGTKWEGIDYDEVCAPVIDEEVYVFQPPGFQDHKGSSESLQSGLKSLQRLHLECCNRKFFSEYAWSTNLDRKFQQQGGCHFLARRSLLGIAKATIVATSTTEAL
ncbi:hypothetical protein Tco_0924370 [Tanacetum coccineum]|uniref:Retrovirus-related Pol polyprotein from transposon TNT 1-94-like beta-barrel domain-containing protein n=1 Tax=Tanacetum coccineum TaxID=301880 RepID=A0ABQ5D3N7_9ASTR